MINRPLSHVSNLNSVNRQSLQVRSILTHDDGKKRGLVVDLVAADSGKSFVEPLQLSICHGIPLRIEPERRLIVQASLTIDKSVQGFPAVRSI
jgi:hypothetical protein